jgi:ABC-type Fe3+ transport system substrate-binding protein
VMGMKTAAYLGIAAGAKHPNAAKLFIQFVTSEEGRKPWGVIGNYSAVTGQAVAEGAIPMDQLNVWTEDDA